MASLTEAHQISYVPNHLYLSLVLCHQGFRVVFFFFSSEVFSKAFDREFWANGSSKQKLSTALVWTVTYATCVSFFGQSVGQRMLDMLQLGMRKTWLCAVQARWTRRGLRDRKVKVAELL